MSLSDNVCFARSKKWPVWACCLLFVSAFVCGTFRTSHASNSKHVRACSSAKSPSSEPLTLKQGFNFGCLLANSQPIAKYKFTQKRTERVYIAVRYTGYQDRSTSEYSQFDPVIELVRADNKSKVLVKDDDGNIGKKARIVANLSNGEYILSVKSYGNLTNYSKYPFIVELSVGSVPYKFIATADPQLGYWSKTHQREYHHQAYTTYRTIEKRVKQRQADLSLMTIAGDLVHEGGDRGRGRTDYGYIFKTFINLGMIVIDNVGNHDTKGHANDEVSYDSDSVYKIGKKTASLSMPDGFSRWVRYRDTWNRATRHFNYAVRIDTDFGPFYLASLGENSKTKSFLEDLRQEIDRNSGYKDAPILVMKHRLEMDTDEIGDDPPDTWAQDRNFIRTNKIIGFLIGHSHCSHDGNKIANSDGREKRKRWLCGDVYGDSPNSVGGVPKFNSAAAFAGRFDEMTLMKIGDEYKLFNYAMRADHLCYRPRYSDGACRYKGFTSSRVHLDDTPTWDFREGESVVKSTATDGHWGHWGPWSRCPPGMFVYEYRLKSEKDQGRRGDDTALNGIELVCKDPNGAKKATTITNKSERWGTWSAVTRCTMSQGPITGFVMQIEDKGHSDDTAANDIDFQCRNGTKISATNQTTWGKWTPKQACPANKAISGFATRVEEDVRGDDTALNGFRAVCSPFPPNR